MNWKFWENGPSIRNEENISANDKIISANNKAKADINWLIEYHTLHCPIISVNNLDERHNKLLSDAIIKKIESIRNGQANTWLSLIHDSDIRNIHNGNKSTI